jgi:spore coat polysaccharide biosynthesis predicted glycosyltransferase SpsG
MYMDKIKTNFEKSEQNIENMNFVLSEPEEKLNILKNIMNDIILLDSYIIEKDKLNKIIEAKKCEMLKGGKIIIC